MKETLAWAVVDKRGAIWRGFAIHHPILFGTRREASECCDLAAGERVTRVRIVPVEEGKDGE